MRDLLCLSSPSYSLDLETGWHDLQECWVGKNNKNGSPVFVLCTHTAPSNDDLGQFIAYAREFVGKQGGDWRNVELIVAVKDGESERRFETGGCDLREVTENSLVAGLVDFQDYYAAIRKRVEEERLPDSEATLSQVYVPSRFEIAGRDADGVNVEQYLREWLQEPTRRQLALLGEYGYGKSTASLMFTYGLISEAAPPRIPILIELRGRSVRNMTPDELIAVWAQPYGIDPRAVMKLLVAGRLVLILEGFDEMDLVGDTAVRISHFRRLWQLSYPLAKLLFTGRPNFFLDDDEMKAALGIGEPLADRPYCDALRLKTFDIDQIRSALSHLPEHIRDEIAALAERDEKFAAVAGRPSDLYLISTVWQREDLGSRHEHINSALVLDLFIRNTYGRQQAKTADGREFMPLDTNERAFFMQGIAALMLKKSMPNQIGREQLRDAIEKLYAFIPDSVTGTSVLGGPRKDPLRLRLSESEFAVDNVETDVRACGVLVADPAKSGSFRFAHKSYMEYLAAQTLADGMLEPRTERSKAFHRLIGSPRETLQSSPPESTAFFAELVQNRLNLTEETAARGLFDVIIGSFWRKTAVGTFLVRNLARIIAPLGSLVAACGVAAGATGAVAGALEIGFKSLFMFTTFAGVLTMILLTAGVTYLIPMRGRLSLWLRCCSDLGVPDPHIVELIGNRTMKFVRSERE